MVKKKIVIQTQNNVKEDFEEEKRKVYNSYTNKVSEEFDYNSYLKYVKSKGVKEYDLEGLTDLFLRGGLDNEEYYFLRDRWRYNLADAK